MQVESPAEIEAARVRFGEILYARVFRELRPRTALPRIEIGIHRYANANAQVRLSNGTLAVKLADTFLTAPDDVWEALARILLGKLFRRPVPNSMGLVYRRWINRREVQHGLDRIRRERGRKQISEPQGEVYNLETLFEEINFKYFHGLMARPRLGWSPTASRTLLGHYDPSHHTIVLSRILDRPSVPREAVEYVMFHEMLHLRHPTEVRGGRRCIHTPAFKEEERRFEGYQAAKAALKHL